MALVLWYYDGICFHMVPPFSDRIIMIQYNSHNFANLLANNRINVAKDCNFGECCIPLWFHMVARHFFIVSDTAGLHIRDLYPWFCSFRLATTQKKVVYPFTLQREFQDAKQKLQRSEVSAAVGSELSQLRCADNFLPRITGCTGSF